MSAVSSKDTARRKSWADVAPLGGPLADGGNGLDGSHSRLALCGGDEAFSVLPFASAHVELRAGLARRGDELLGEDDGECEGVLVVFARPMEGRLLVGLLELGELPADERAAGDAVRSAGLKVHW